VSEEEDNQDVYGFKARPVVSARVTASTSTDKKARARYGQLPRFSPEVCIPYANTRAGALSPAQTVRAMLDSDAWRDVIKPELDALEQRRRNAKKVQPLYSCEELESVFLFQQVAGIDTIRETRTHLTSHAGAEARRLLGFEHLREGKSQRKPIHSVPSEATLSRYRLAWAPADAGYVAPATEAQVARGKTPTVYDFKKAEVERQKAAVAARADLYERLFARWLAEYAQTPEAAEATRALYMDGTALHSYFNCLITKQKKVRDGHGKLVKDEDGEVVTVAERKNEKPRPRARCRVKPVLDSRGRVVWNGLLSEEQWQELAKQKRAPFRRYWAYSAEGGYAGGDSPSRRGHGYSIIDVVDAAGMPIGFNVGPIRNNERAQANELLDRFGPTVDLLPDEGIRVLVADSGFNGYTIPKRVRELGMLESIHVVSGASSQRSKQHRREREAEKRPILYRERKTYRTHERWYTNGLYELSCRCGQGEVQKRFRRDQDGKLIPSLEGQCPNCGPVTITSGHWSYHDKRWHKVDTSNPKDVPTLAFGNGLTFGSPIAEAYGKRRFALQEGVHSIMTSRFGLTRGRRRIKFVDEARLRTAMTFCVMHTLAAEERKRQAASGSRQLRRAA
jgi:hypothetical protein